MLRRKIFSTLYSHIRMFSYNGELVETFLNLEKISDNLFRSTHQMANLNSTVIYGGQVIGQSLYAALRTVPNFVHPHSLHCYFIKAGNSNERLLYQVDRIRDAAPGRSFCTRGVKAIQGSETIFSSQISFCKLEPDSIRHQDEMPKVPPPESLKDTEELLKELLKREDLTPKMRDAVIQRVEADTTFSVRPCDPEAYLRMKTSSARQNLWVKSKSKIGDNLELQQAVAAYISDHSMVSTPLMPHTSAGFRVGMAFSLDHSMWFHRHKFAIDEWMLYENHSPVAGGSRALTFGRLWTREGDLAVTTAQESLIRSPRAKL